MEQAVLQAPNWTSQLARVALAMADTPERGLRALLAAIRTLADASGAVVLRRDGDTWQPVCADGPAFDAEPWHPLALDNTATPRFELRSAERLEGCLVLVGDAVQPAPEAALAPLFELAALALRNLRRAAEREQALRQSETFALGVLNALPSLVAALDRDGQIVAVNDAWAASARANGLADERTIGLGQNYLAVCRAASSHGSESAPETPAGVLCRVSAGDGADTARAALAGIEAVLQGSRELYTLEYSFELASGRRWFLLYVTPLPAPGGAVVAHIDISDRKLMEEQLLQVQKLDAMGRLAGGVAHDFNNLLTVINGYADLLLAQLPTDDTRRDLADEILKAGGQATALTGQLLAFGRRQRLTLQPIDLNVAVDDAERLLRRLIGEAIDLHTRLDPAVGLVRADSGQGQQMLVNLAVNARDAMPGGGRLDLETARVDLAEAAASRQGLVQAGTYARLTVRDTGCGMDEAVRARIFEPFFTTKAAGQGTGLGLATVYGIVKQSGGSIQVASQPGRGTTFTIHLPLIAGPRPAPSVALAPSAPRGSETILLVEDQAQVRALASATLGALGYVVLEAGNAAEALELCAERAAPIDLLIADVVMPGMSGIALAAALSARWANLRTLYISGHTDEAVARQGAAARGAPLLQKPFTRQALAARVRRLLDEPRASAAHGDAPPI